MKSVLFLLLSIIIVTTGTETDINKNKFKIYDYLFGWRLANCVFSDKVIIKKSHEGYNPVNTGPLKNVSLVVPDYAIGVQLTGITNNFTLEHNWGSAYARIEASKLKTTGQNRVLYLGIGWWGPPWTLYVGWMNTTQ